MPTRVYFHADAGHWIKYSAVTGVIQFPDNPLGTIKVSLRCGNYVILEREDAKNFQIAFAEFAEKVEAYQAEKDAEIE